ncbi:MAG: hypothetical protein L0G99_10060, partial [Propionibacteriales bacterium]|nr:hypothetical protein [Propionibacteriales bacterium]
MSDPGSVGDQHGATQVLLTPLLPADPPRVGPFWLDARIISGTAGTAYVAHPDTGPDHEGADTPYGSDDVMVIRLAEGAAADAAARERLAGLVNKLHIDTVVARGGASQDEGRWAGKFIPEKDLEAEDGVPEAPWVALTWQESAHDVALADTILAEVELRTTAPQGQPTGPEYQHYWTSKVRPGLARLWPLPWPGRHERAGWRTILVSWLLMLLLAAIAVLIVVLLFKDQPPIQPPPPKEATGSPSGSPPPDSSSPSPQSGSPSPQSGSPSPESGSPSPQSGSPSPQSGSPSPSDS